MAEYKLSFTAEEIDEKLRDMATKISIWQPNTEYKVGDWVLAQFNTEYGSADETSSFQYITGLMCKKNHISPTVDYPNLAEDFNECWAKIDFNADYAFYAICDGGGYIIPLTYATKEELAEAIGQALEGDY